MSYGLRALLVVLAAGTLWYAWRMLQQEPPTAAAAATEAPRYALSDASWVRLNPQGQPEFRVTARSIQYYADQHVHMDHLALDALGGPQGAWRVEAAAGDAPPRERRLLLSGDVVAAGALQDAGSLVFRTDRLWVDQLRQELHTDRPVAVEGGGRNAQAVGLRADFKGESVQLLREVQVNYAPHP